MGRQLIRYSPLDSDADSLDISVGDVRWKIVVRHGLERIIRPLPQGIVDGVCNRILCKLMPIKSLQVSSQRIGVIDRLERLQRVEVVLQQGHRSRPRRSEKVGEALQQHGVVEDHGEMLHREEQLGLRLEGVLLAHGMRRHNEVERGGVIFLLGQGLEAVAICASAFCLQRGEMCRDKDGGHGRGVPVSLRPWLRLARSVRHDASGVYR